MIKLESIINAATSPKAYSTYAAIGVGVTVVLAILNTRKQCKIENEQKSQEGYSEKEACAMACCAASYSTLFLGASTADLSWEKVRTLAQKHGGLII